MFQSVKTIHMAMTVSTAVAVTVLITLPVTKKRVNVKGDVIRDMLIVTAAKVYSYTLIHIFFYFCRKHKT